MKVRLDSQNAAQGRGGPHEAKLSLHLCACLYVSKSRLGLHQTRYDADSGELPDPPARPQEGDCQPHQEEAVFVVSGQRGRKVEGDV